MSDRRLIRATALLFCLRILAAFLIDLAPQETYYWNYAEHPALSYFDHPPMIAWIIGAGQFFLGKNALGVRLGVTEEFEEQWSRLKPDDPQWTAYEVYAWLGAVQESLVQAMN